MPKLVTGKLVSLVHNSTSTVVVGTSTVRVPLIRRVRLCHRSQHDVARFLLFHPRMPNILIHCSTRVMHYIKYYDKSIPTGGAIEKPDISG
jgi:hypothetical protein